jgi:hypothetical protein
VINADIQQRRATIKTKRFEVGDRIRVRISTPFVHVDTLGTIVQVYRPVADAYTIQFDQDSHHWVMQACDLERLSATAPRVIVDDMIAQADAQSESAANAAGKQPTPHDA